MKKDPPGPEADDIEWRDPPPKILGRKPMERTDAIEAGRQVRARLEADRRARGVPKWGVVYEGEKADYEIPANNRVSKEALAAAALEREAKRRLDPNANERERLNRERRRNAVNHI